MKAILSYILFISLLSLLIKCDKDEFTSRNYPRLKTLPVTEITSEGAKFSAEIIYRGDFEVINYGFIWSESENPILENSDRVIYSENIKTNHFSKTIETTLKEKVSYFVKAFVKTADYIVYGESVDFLSLGSKAPEIKTIYPGHGTIGDTITIKGSCFSYLNATNKVYFDGIESTLVSSSDTLVKVIIPVVGKDSISVALSILGNISEYDGAFSLTTPIIEDFIPKQAAIDDTITITGTSFSYLPESNILKIGGIQCNIVYSSKNQIKAIIPSSLELNNIVSLTIAGQENISNKQFEFLPPIINSFDNTDVSFGEEVTMIGHNFSFISENNLIFLNGAQAKVLNATKENILFKIPNNLSNAESTLTLKVAGRELNYEFIKIKAPIIQLIEASVISHYNNGNLTISGENFNPLAGKNSILLGDRQATIVSSSNNQIVVEFPRSIIPKVELSVLDTLDVTVTVLDQSSVLEKSLIIDYKSTWTKMRDFSGNPRIFGAHFSIGDKGYIGLGGGDEFDNWYKDFWEYDPISDMWIRLEDFPGTARSKFATFVIGNNAYIICGTIDNQYTESNNLSEVWKFNGVTHTWTQMNDFPGGARWSPFGFSIGNIGYFGGGVYGNYTQKKDFWQYDPNTDSWSQLDNIPDNIWEEDLFAISDSEFGYLLADYCGSPCSKRYFWKYIPSTQEWQSIESMPGPYRETTGFNINNRFYIGTGLFSLWTGTSAFYSYNPNLNEWANMPFFVESRRTASSFALNDFGYLLLGKSGSHSANKIDVWKFDPTKTD